MVGYPQFQFGKGIWSSHELQYLDLGIGHQDSIPSYNHQGDMSYTYHLCFLRPGGRYVPSELLHRHCGLMQDCSNSSALAVELLPSCTVPVKLLWRIWVSITHKANYMHIMGPAVLFQPTTTRTWPMFRRSCPCTSIFWTRLVTIQIWCPLPTAQSHCTATSTSNTPWNSYSWWTSWVHWNIPYNPVGAGHRRII